MYHIFLSYSRIDSDWVDRLHAELESRGFEAWLDRRDLPLNLPWLNQISDAVEECALFVFCESEAARLLRGVRLGTPGGRASGQAGDSCIGGGVG